MPEAAWSLHPQLENDTSPVRDLALCRVLAINDADYPWLVLVPRRVEHDPEKWNPVSRLREARFGGRSKVGKDHAPSALVEIADLSAADAARLMEEIAAASRALKAVTGCDKLNIAAIGNVVPQLHVHIVARWKTDPLWPKPVWGHATPRPRDAEGFARFLDAIRTELNASP